MRQGTFYSVGVGPGDPELLTYKAARILAACPVIAAPRTKSGETLALDIARAAVDLGGKTVLTLEFSMDRNPLRRRAAQKAAADAVAAELDRGADVAMPNLGDVSIYATGSYVLELLRARGYAVEMVPGVPSFCAVAARLGVSLTEMDAALHIAPGGVSPEAALALPGTKVFMKSGRQLPGLLAALGAKGKLQGSMLVANCGLAGEAVYEDLGQAAPEDGAGYFATVIVKE